MSQNEEIEIENHSRDIKICKFNFVRFEYSENRDSPDVILIFATLDKYSVAITSTINYRQPNQGILCREVVFFKLKYMVCSTDVLWSNLGHRVKQQKSFEEYGYLRYCNMLLQISKFSQRRLFAIIATPSPYT